MNSPSKNPIYLPVVFAFVAPVIAYTFDLVDFNHAKDAVLACCALLLGFSLILRPDQSIRVPRFIPVAVVILIVSAIYHSMNDATSPLHVIAALNHYLLAFMFVLLFANAVPPQDRSRVTAYALTTSACIVSLLAWIQYFDLLPTLFPAFPANDQHMYSVFGNQNLLGGFIGITIPLTVYRITRDSKPNPAQILLLALLASACIVSGSRSGWLAAVIGSACVIPYRNLKRHHFLLAGIGVLLTGILIVLNQDATIDRITNTFSSNDVGFQTRIWIWSGAVLLIQDNVFLGVGPGMFQYWSPTYLGDAAQAAWGTNLRANEIHTLQAHSTLLDLIIEFGVVGACAAIAWTTALFKNRSSAVWGSMIACTVYALINTITTATPHLLIALLLYICVSKSNERTFQPSSSRSRVVCASMVVLLALPLTGLFTIVTLYPSYQLAKARQSFAYTSNPDTTERLYHRAAENVFAFPQTHLEHGLILLNRSSGHAKDELETALTGLDTGEVHLALSHVYAALNDPQKALQFAESGVGRWPRYYPGWEHLIQLHDETQRIAVIARSQTFLTLAEVNQLHERFGIGPATGDLDESPANSE